MTTSERRIVSLWREPECPTARLEWPALASFAHIDRYGLGELAHDWWSEMPDTRHSKLFHRLND